MTRRAITLDAEMPGGPYLVAECNETGWNGYHVPHLTAAELADHVNAHKATNLAGWDDVEVMTDAPEGIIMRTEGGDDFYAYDETGRAWVDGLVWVTAYDEEGNERPVPPTVAETVEKVKAEVLDYIAEGHIPASVSTFSELHNYCDANVLGGMCDEGFPELFGPRYDGDDDPMVADPWMVHCNEVQDEVDSWLRKGGARRV